jgi:methyl-accepting chemotaxis protein
MQWWSNSAARDALAQAQAVSKSQAVIEFNMDGTIITANRNFLDAMGYRLEEIQGKHHSMFVAPARRDSAAYREFWANLNRGSFQSGEFKRIGKGGKDVWIQGAYNPIPGRDGEPVKVIKFATDITARKIRGMEDEGKIAAIGRSQAVIEFNLDGTIVTANDSFLRLLGYTLAEIVGKHHDLFVEPAARDGAAYRAFWASLSRGEFQSEEYKRIGKGGKEVWILATYNPILDDTGKPFKVVKFASDVSEQKQKTANLAGQIEAIGKSQAVIEFGMDGKVLTANQNFLSALGYSLGEIQGRHHSMFVTPAERDTGAYRAFWDSLNRGDYQTGEYQRVGKGGKDVWIQASYNPILDLNGKPYKVVKYATETTAQTIARMKSEHIQKMLEPVASGAEELSASVRDIAASTAKSKEIANDAVSKVETADHQAQRLSTAAEAMEGIVQLIGDITGQINLLALNATIESARAGEAGRGFAVVASEVKNLANQAKHATDRIAGEISALNSISGEVVNALHTIRDAIQAVGSYVTSTAVAIDEQSAVTTTMSASIQRAAAEASSIGGRATA